MERPTSEDDEPKLEKGVPPMSPTSPSSSVDHEPAPPLAGHEEKKKEETVRKQIITPNGIFKRSSGDGIYATGEAAKQLHEGAHSIIVNRPPKFTIPLWRKTKACLLCGSDYDLAGHEEKKKEETVREQIITPNGIFKRSSGDGIFATGEAAKQLHKGAHSIIENRLPIFTIPPIRKIKTRPLCASVSDFNSDSESLRNEGIYSSVKSQLASGSKGTKSQSSSACGSKGTKSQSSSACGQVPLPTESKKR